MAFGLPVGSTELQIPTRALGRRLDAHSSSSQPLPLSISDEPSSSKTMIDELLSARKGITLKPFPPFFLRQAEQHLVIPNLAA
ncbi:hypothetical protein DM860_017437 [Cuscuta australis]|uniref:Uncharacterized protein n=1 Tax=Cuscuta australis TaxID=267555 RepID=A0A328DJK2_9ASTE|nr:hypothetical protein DM860_017437 [Cuscuta australis]